MTERLRAPIRLAWQQVADWLLAAGCSLLALVLYLQTLAPSVATLFDDSLEFPLVSYRLGIAHPTGYPLYTLLGKLFTLGPWQNVAWAVNLLSAVAGALTVALVYLVARELTRRRLPALLGAVALAVSPVFWSQAIVAEVYTLNSAFVAALLWLALRWARTPLAPVKPFSLLLVEPVKRQSLFLPGEGLWTRLPLAVRRAAHRLYALYRRFFPPVPPKQRLRLHPLLYVLAAVYGLSLTHHRLMLLLLPALLLFAFLVERRIFGRAALLGPEHPDRPRWLQLASRPILLLASCLLLPLLLYLYLPLRGRVGSLDGAYTNTLSGFWQWVMASGYSTFFADNPLARDLDAAFYADLFWQQFGPVGLALALVGIVGLAAKHAQGGPQSAAAAGLWSRRSRLTALALTGLAFPTYAAFALIYRVPDVEVFFIPAFLITAVWIGVGLDFAADLLRVRGRSLAVRRPLALCGVLIFLAAVLQPLTIAIRYYPDLDLSRHWIVHDYGQYALEQELPDNSTMVGILGEMNLLRYFQETTGRRADIETIVADDEAARREAVGAALAQGQAVFITRPLPGLADEYALAAVTGLIDVTGEDLETVIRVGEPSTATPDLPRPTNQEIVPDLELLGYGVREHHGHWQAWARLRLWWRAPVAADDRADDRTDDRTDVWGEPFKVSARLVDADGNLVAATDAEPVAGAYPATAWRPGEVVADAYEIPLPAGLPPGDYRPLVIVYEPATGAELGRAELEPVYLRGSPARPPRRALEASVAETVYARFGSVELLGFTPPDPEVAYRPGDALPLALLWQARGQPSGDLRLSFWLEDVEEYPQGAEPVGGRFSTDQWHEGQTVRHWPDLRVPDDVPPGTYRLKMRVIRNGRPVPWGRGLIPLGSDLDLGAVQVGR